MSASVMALTLAYVLLLFLLLLAVLRSELRPAWKFALSAACAVFYLWHYQSLQAFRGWPASDRLPQRFEVIHSITVEPDLRQGLDGAIYVWIRDLDAAQPVPRAYRFDYDRQLHRKIDDNQRRQRQGERRVGAPQPGGSIAAPELEFESVIREKPARKGSDNSG